MENLSATLQALKDAKVDTDPNGVLKEMLNTAVESARNKTVYARALKNAMNF